MEAQSQFVSSLQFQKRIFDRFDTKENQECRLFVNSVQQDTKRTWKNPNSKTESQFDSSMITYPLETVKSDNLHGNLMKFLHFLPEELQDTQNRLNR